MKSSGKVAKAPLRETLTHHWREVIIAAGLKVVETAPFYIFSTFVVSYATTTLTYQKSQVLKPSRWCAGVNGDDPADTCSRIKLVVNGCTLLASCCWVCSSCRGSCCSTPAPPGITLATVITFGILWSPITAVLGTLCSEIFSANGFYTPASRWVIRLALRWQAVPRR